MNAIVAVDNCWGIGNEGKLLFNAPQDMRFFKEKTVGCTVIMGRKTLQSLPRGAPLAGRDNIILSKDSGFTVDGATVFHSIFELLSHIKQLSGDKLFVIGGEDLYNELLPFCKTAYVTRFNTVKTADKFFCNLDNLSNWELSSTSVPYEYEDYSFTFCEYRNKDEVRYEHYTAK